MTNVFGLEVSQPAVSRGIESLKQINLVEGINNPVGNATLAWIKLTNKGRKLQRLYFGSTAEWKDRLKIVSVRTLEEQIVIDSSNINKRTA
jgi:DNA-binding MarR family transcriptional regulator